MPLLPRWFSLWLCLLMTLLLVVYFGYKEGATAYGLATCQMPASPDQDAIRRDAYKQFQEGKAAHIRGDFLSAIARYQETLKQLALLKSPTNEDKTQKGRCLWNIGNCHENLAQWQEAYDGYHDALLLFEEVVNTRYMVSARIRLGIAAYMLNRLEEAQDIETRALDLAEKTDEAAIKRSIPEILNVLDYVYILNRRYEDAVRSLPHAADLCRQYGKPGDVAYALLCLSVAQDYLGHYDEAARSYDEVYGLYNQLGLSGEKARVLNDLAMLELSRTNPAKAQIYLERALELYRGLKDTNHEADCLSNLGDVYFQLGDYHNARAAFESALKLLPVKARKLLPEQARDRNAIAGNLSELQGMEGDPKRAETQLEAALKKAEELGDEEGKAYIQEGLGMLALKRGDDKKASHCYIRALEGWKHLGQSLGQVRTLQSLSALSLLQGHLRETQGYLDQALKLEPMVHDQLVLSQLYNTLGLLAYSQKRYQDAAAHFKTAIQHSEAVLRQIPDPTLVGSFQETHQAALYARCAVALVKNGKTLEALDTIERGRGVGLAAAARLDRIDLAAVLGSDLERWQVAQMRLSAAVRIWSALQSQMEKASSPTEQANLEIQCRKAEQNYDEADRQYLQLRSQLSEAHPAFQPFVGYAPTSPKALLSLACAHRDTLYLITATVDDRTTLLIALHAGGAVPFFLHAMLAERAAAWRQTIQAISDRLGASLEREGALQRMGDKEPNAARALSEAVLGPLERAGLLQPHRFRRLMVVKDGPLLDIPFNALMDTRGRRLVDRYVISGAVSLSSLLSPPSQRQPEGTLFYVADPTGKETPAPVNGHSGKRLGRSYHALPALRSAVLQIAGMVPKPRFGLVGIQAKERTVKREMGRYAILLFGTHGILDTQDSLRSYLLLAPNASQGDREGRLYAWEIASQPLQARLAVLAACEAANGQKRGGEGLEGLAWAFQAAGCPSVVAPYWEVEQTATGRLITRYFYYLKARHLPKDEALRAAIQDVRKDPNLAHPYYWAGFDLIGDSTPLLFSHLTDASSH